MEQHLTVSCPGPAGPRRSRGYDPVVPCLHYEPDRDIPDPDKGPEGVVFEDLLWGRPGPAGRFCDGQGEVKRPGKGEGECLLVPEVHCCVVVAGKGNKGKGIRCSGQVRWSPSNTLYIPKLKWIL